MLTITMQNTPYLYVFGGRGGDNSVDNGDPVSIAIVILLLLFVSNVYIYYYLIWLQYYILLCGLYNILNRYTTMTSGAPRSVVTVSWMHGSE